jgi:hypothetical protein
MQNSGQLWEYAGNRPTFRRKNLGTWFGLDAAAYLFPLREDSVSEGDTRAIVRELYDA